MFQYKRLLRNYSDICVSQESSVDSLETTPYRCPYIVVLYSVHSNFEYEKENYKPR